VYHLPFHPHRLVMYVEATEKKLWGM
jgi:hypothetical protein